LGPRKKKKRKRKKTVSIGQKQKSNREYPAMSEEMTMSVCLMRGS
jgi:hypothetical protein